MKKHKNMLILLAVFVVLVGVYFIMSHVNKKQAEGEIEETVMVTDITGITSIKYTDGEQTMALIKEDGIWYYSENKALDLDEDLVEDIAYSFGQVEAERKLEGADEPASYGLEEPAYTISLTDADGEEVVLYIGNETEGNYYATINDKETIYTISSTVIDSLEFDITALEVEVEEEGTESDATE